MRKNKYLVFSICLAVVVCAVEANSEPIVDARKIDGRNVNFLVRGIAGPRLPERVRVRIDGQELSDSKLSLLPLSVGVFADSSIGCKLSAIEAPLASHIQTFIRMLPSESKVSVSTFTAQGETTLVQNAQAKSIQSISLPCTSARSRSVGDLVLSLKKRQTSFDLLVVYSSGNLYLDDARTQALASVAPKRFIYSYTARPSEEKNTTDTIFSVRAPQETSTQWFASLLNGMSSNLTLSASVDAKLPATLKAGEYRVDLDFLSKGTSVVQTSAYLPYSPTGFRSSGFFERHSLVVYLLILTALAEFVILLALYYRTPKCKSCKKAILRSEGMCFFCLKKGEGLLLFDTSEGKKAEPIRGVASVGADRSFRIRPSNLSGPGGFELRKHGTVYQLTAKNSKLKLNDQVVNGSRYVRSGDVISIGEFACQFYVKA